MEIIRTVLRAREGALTFPLLRILGLTALVGTVGLVALMLAGAGTNAQSGLVLADNIDKKNDRTVGFGHEYGQAFTTGSSANGYRLMQFSLRVTVNDQNGTQPTYKMELWSAVSKSNPKPKQRLTTLTNPTAITDGKNTWTFGGSGYEVQPNTSYVILWDVLDPPGSIGANFSATLENEEVDGSWPIDDSALKKGKSEGLDRWDFITEALRIEIRGSVKSVTTTTTNRAQTQQWQQPPDPPNLARGEIQPSAPRGAQRSISSERVGLLGSLDHRARSFDSTGIHQIPVRMGEISSNKPKDASGSLDLKAISASVEDDLSRHSRGFYVTVMVESISDRRHMFNSGFALDAERQAYELAHGAPLLKAQIWHVYHHIGRGMNTVELLGDAFVGRDRDRLVEPAEICLPVPSREPERAQIAVRGRHDRHWTILDSHLTFDGRICAETTRVAWFTIVLEPRSEDASA